MPYNRKSAVVFDYGIEFFHFMSALHRFLMETVALHEIGHLLGLLHASVPDAVMQAIAITNSTRRVLMQDDIDGFRSLGYPFE